MVYRVKMKKIILLVLCILILLGLSIITYSATLILDETNSGNMGDSMVMESDPDVNKGLDPYTYMTIWGETNNARRGYIKYDMSRLIDTTVSNVILNFNRTSTTIANNLTKVYANISWGESTITWNNQPCGTVIDDYGKCNV